MSETNGNIPVPKFQQGQRVFYGTITDTHTTLDCPDCLGVKTWTVTTRRGETLDVPCARCQRRWGSPVDTGLTLIEWRANVRPLTVGQVRIVSPARDRDYDDPVTYMCEETGIGSGSVYKESQLFATEAEALCEVEGRMAIQRVERDAKNSTQWTLALAKESIRDAVNIERSAAVWSACYHFGQLKEKIEKWIDDGGPSIDDMREALSWDLAYHVDPKNNPIVALVQAARRGDSLADILAQFDFVPEEKAEVIQL